ncbi:MAG: kelch repeat-containing protein [Aureliella sp.]
MLACIFDRRDIARRIHVFACSLAGLLFTSICVIAATRCTAADSSADSWQIIDATWQPTARHEASFVAVDDKMFLLGGRRINPVDVFDPLAKSWASLRPSPIEMHHFQAVSYDHKIYVVGAMTGPYPNETPLERVVVYDPSNDKFSFSHGIPAERRRGAAGAAIYDDKIYVIGGIINGHQDGTVPWFDCFDPQTGSWEVLPDAPHSRDHFQAVVIGDRLYAAAGRRTSNLTNQTFELTIPEVDVYDFKSQRWLPAETIPNLPTPRAGNMAAAVGHSLVIGGGESGNQVQAHGEVEVLNTRTNTWHSIESLVTGRHGSSFAVFGDSLYTASGCARRGGEPEQTSIESILVSAVNAPASKNDPTTVGVNIQVEDDTNLTIPLNETLELDFTGPSVSESDDDNPFTNYRLEVRFRNGEEEYRIRGFFNADGDAANSGAEAGNTWSCRFAPPRLGKWTYEAKLLKGDWVAIGGGKSVGIGDEIAIDASKGAFVVTPSESDVAFFSAGRIQPNGHYYQHANGKTWLKFGTNSPENLLGYEDFDGTYRIAANKRSGEATIGTPLHTYSFHQRDWKPGNPTWRGQRGKSLVGGINYLASQGVNSIYFLTMNIEGDGKDVWPFASPDDLTRFDCSKLDQWEIVFEHMLQSGLAIHFITQETENELLLDDGDVGRHRKLYYQELISRFAHHPAVFWNIGEESGRSSWKDDKGLKSNSTEQQRAIATYLDATDPYGNTVLIHTHSHEPDQDYGLQPLLGHAPLDGLSLQVGDPHHVHRDVVKWTRLSQKANRPWVVSMDEIGPATYGAPTDDVDPRQDKMRGDVLWGSLLGGASGVEWYFGYEMLYNDLNSEDWRAREVLWTQSRYAKEFLSKFDVASMKPSDDLLTGAGTYCLAEEGKAYIVYRAAGQGNQKTELNLSQVSGEFTVTWFNPRQGGERLAGSVSRIAGGSPAPIGLPPTDPNEDWVASIRLVTGN